MSGRDVQLDNLERSVAAACIFLQIVKPMRYVKHEILTRNKYMPLLPCSRRMSFMSGGQDNMLSVVPTLLFAADLARPIPAGRHQHEAKILSLLPPGLTVTSMYHKPRSELNIALEHQHRNSPHICSVHNNLPDPNNVKTILSPSNLP